jgi:hypothetical protein
VDCCVGVYGTFRTIPTVESYGAGFFCSLQNLIAVKLLNLTKSLTVRELIQLLATLSYTM